MNIKSILVIVISFLLATSCSIEKRRYTKGYHIEWNNNIAKHKSTKQQKGFIEPEMATIKQKDTILNQNLTLKSANNNVLEVKKTEEILKNKTSEPNKQDKKATIQATEVLKTKINKVTNKVKPIIQKQTTNNRYSNESTEFFTIFLIVLASIALLIGLLGAISLTAQESTIYVLLVILLIALIAFLSWIGLGDFAFIFVDIMFLL